jgi:hypothetical protein
MTITDPRFQSPLLGFRPFGVHLLDETEVRRRLGDWYALHEGMRSSGLEEDEYARFLFPNDRLAWRRRAADEMYSCALRFLACARVLGIPHPVLKVPYEQRVGQAVSDCERVAATYQACVRDLDLADYEPQVGDVLCQHGAYGPHVSCVTEAVTYTSLGAGSGADLVLSTVDGGQGGKGDMQIARNLYVWRPGGRVASVEPPAHSRASPGPERHLVWVIDAWRLVLEAGLLKAT